MSPSRPSRSLFPRGCLARQSAEAENQCLNVEPAFACTSSRYQSFRRPYRAAVQDFGVILQHELNGAPEGNIHPSPTSGSQSHACLALSDVLA